MGELVNHPHIVELLDVLSPWPQTATALGARVRLRPRLLMAALRILAARGLVAGDRGGSWDTRAPHTATYWLTDRGRRTADMLSSFWVWTALYARPDGSGGQ
ncbi:MAG: hypothetical protein EOP32_02755 [Rhodococcus sp. (in: high G+C Gram-positive bacteria)]|nr:MAG: hypothetical protein EOP32_02755 [Rhodococcus sp. (in: high G+C Gram-positive bacteria)]